MTVVLTKEILHKCIPAAAAERIDLFLDPLNVACKEFDISTTKIRLAAFIGQICHESGSLKFVKENLNYSADRLCAVFPKYFTTESAPKYGRNPQAIANKVYSSRMGNGDESSGDGWRYCGRGLIQLTGKDNYTKCGTALHVDLHKNPDYLETPIGATRSAAWFWNSNKLNELADADNILSITKKINGGTIGLAERTEDYHRAVTALNG